MRAALLAAAVLALLSLGADGDVGCGGGADDCPDGGALICVETPASDHCSCGQAE